MRDYVRPYSVTLETEEILAVLRLLNGKLRTLEQLKALANEFHDLHDLDTQSSWCEAYMVHSNLIKTAISETENRLGKADSANP